MITLITGNKKERKDFIQSVCEQQGLNSKRTQYFYTDNFCEQSFESVVPVNTGLFDERECFIIMDAVRDLPIKTILKSYAETEHILIFSEDSILKKDLIVFKKIDAQITEFKKEVKSELKKYNTFVLADLFGARDKKNLWFGYRQAIDSGISVEEIHGILFWQLKNLAIVKNGKNVHEMSPFVYKKNQSYIKNFSKEDIRSLSNDMTKMFHNRDTYSTLEIDLEKFILDL